MGGKPINCQYVIFCTSFLAVIWKPMEQSWSAFLYRLVTRCGRPTYIRLPGVGGLYIRLPGVGDPHIKIDMHYSMLASLPLLKGDWPSVKRFLVKYRTTKVKLHKMLPPRIHQIHIYSALTLVLMSVLFNLVMSCYNIMSHSVIMFPRLSQ